MCPPKFYGLPKIYTLDTPLRTIVSSCGSLTYGVAKELTKILKPFVGKSPHHINSTHDFLEQVKQFTLVPGDCLSSYDVSALFTPVPVDPALGVIKDLLEKDSTLKDRTILPVKDIILLLEFCLKNMYFSFQDQFYEQIRGVAMGSPVNPIVAYLCMENFEQKALTTIPHPPGFGIGMWMTHFSSRRKSTSRTFYNTLTVLTLAIQFTVEINKEDGAIPFLDAIVKPEADENLSITVYRKPTLTDQYLQWDSHHHLSGKFSVINTLTNRAQTVCSNPELLCKEMDHLRKHSPNVNT